MLQMLMPVLRLVDCRDSELPDESSTSNVTSLIQWADFVAPAGLNCVVAPIWVSTRSPIEADRDAKRPGSRTGPSSRRSRRMIFATSRSIPPNTSIWRLGAVLRRKVHHANLGLIAARLLLEGVYLLPSGEVATVYGAEAVSFG